METKDGKPKRKQWDVNKKKDNVNDENLNAKFNMLEKELRDIHLELGRH